MVTTNSAIRMIHKVLRRFFNEVMQENYVRKERSQYSLNEMGFLEDYEDMLLIARMEPDLPEDTDGLKLSLTMLHGYFKAYQPMYFNTFPAHYDFKQMSALQKIMHEEMKKQYTELEKEYE